MPSVYNYRHVELDKVGRGKRVIKPPGGETADIFGLRAAANSEQAGYSSASSQAGSDVASSRVHIDADQHSVGGHSSISSHLAHQAQEGARPGAGCNTGHGQASPSGSLDSANTNNQQPLLMADDFKPTTTMVGDGSGNVGLQQQQQQPMNLQQQKLIQQQLQQQQEANRSPKKTIPVIRRNPITGEIYDNPSERQQPVVRVRQPPGGRSSGIF